MRSLLRNIIALPCLLLLLATAVSGNPAIAQPAPVPDKDGFVPEVRPPEMGTKVDESVPAAPLVAAAYGFIWLAVLVYVGTVHARSRRLEEEVAALRQRLQGPRGS